LLTKGRAKGSCTFIAPLEEGTYFLKMVRNDKEEMAAASFKVIAPRKVKPTPTKASPVVQAPSAAATRKIIKRFDSPDSVIEVGQQMAGGNKAAEPSLPFVHLASQAR